MAGTQPSEMGDESGHHPLLKAPKRPKPRKRRLPGQGRLDRLFHWNDLPDYLKDNEYIVTGYRADTGIVGAVKSLFRVHNESGNIWTHLIGTLYCILLHIVCLSMPLHAVLKEVREAIQSV
jgi:hypothetical protein